MLHISSPALGPEELSAAAEALSSPWLGLGAVTRAFEEELAEYLGAAHVVAVNSGTAALHLALAAHGIGAGDEVVVPSITFAASVQAVLAVGATPVFADALDETGLLDPDDVVQRLTPRTRAIMPVHLGGSPCDHDRLSAIAESSGAVLIEDAAHAFGSEWRGRRIGATGTVCFSFDPIKTITCGEGGAVAVADAAVAEGIRRWRGLGFDGATGAASMRTTTFREVCGPGLLAHLPILCAAIGRAQLRKVDAFIARRRVIARRYDAAFGSLRNARIRPVDYDTVVPHIYMLRVPGGRRDAAADALEAGGVGTGLHYVANHVQPYFRQFVRGPLPVADRLWRELLTIPLHAALTDDDVARVVEAVQVWDASVD